MSVAALEEDGQGRYMVRVEMVVFVDAHDAKQAFAAAESALCVKEVNGLLRGSCTVGKPRRIRES